MINGELNKFSKKFILSMECLIALILSLIGYSIS